MGKLGEMPEGWNDDDDDDKNNNDDNNNNGDKDFNYIGLFHVSHDPLRQTYTTYVKHASDSIHYNNTYTYITLQST